jgi:hypothetical protein
VFGHENDESKKPTTALGSGNVRLPIVHRIDM